jgi:hypothetical protein
LINPHGPIQNPSDDFQISDHRLDTVLQGAEIQLGRSGFQPDIPELLKMIASRTASPIVEKTTRVDILTAYTLFAACSLVIASIILVAAALADTVWQSRAASEMIGWPGLYLLAPSFICLAHAGALCARRDAEDAQNSIPLGGSPKQVSASEKSAIQNHPMRDRLLDG